MKYSIAILLIVVLSACATKKEFVTEPQQQSAELRGIWIASVENIDWPASKTLPIEQLQSSYLEILDFYKALNFNAVFVQIRTAGDALYPSDLAPWSRYLTGTEGQALERDILPWLIDQTHQRGMEFHAWMNPYRATTSLDTSLLAPSHAFYAHREWMIKYGNRYYFNPALTDVQKHILNVIDEVVVGYDIDGIHFDDYFYPYKIKDEVFRDSTQYANRINLALSRDDWRRQNINTFVESCHNRIKTQKNYVQFGVSPFGVWRNKSNDSTGSDTRAGQTVYDDLYADTRTWIQQGWLDYIAPQLYWSMEYPAASHRTLVDWWVTEAGDLPLYIGLGAYKVQHNHDSAWNDIHELSRQIQYSRNTEIVDGFIVFSAKSVKNKLELRDDLLEHSFQTTALTATQQRWYTSMPDVKTTVVEDGKNRLLTIPTYPKEARSISMKYFQPKGLFRREKLIQNQTASNINQEFIIPPKASHVVIELFNSMGIASKPIIVLID